MDDDRFDWLAEYREARDATINLLRMRLINEPRVANLDRVIDLPFFRGALFATLITRYRLTRRISRREVIRELEDGSFWENFLKFLQSIDWEKVIELVITLIEAILKILG